MAFTEPSAEVDLPLTGKDGSENWVEMGGAGSVDPNVFDAVGIERLALRKHEITDIRRFSENDLRFLSQWWLRCTCARQISDHVR